jgi:hypothetical protein
MIGRDQGSRRPVPGQGPRGAAPWAALAFIVIAGCGGGARQWVAPVPVDPPVPREMAVADTAFTPIRTAAPAPAARLPEMRIDVVLRVLHVQVPRAQRAVMSSVWELLREDVGDSATRQQLFRNGVRVGVGRTERWAAVQTAVDAIEGRRVRDLPPLRVLPGVPLLLELDRQPKDQTIFCLERDGIISGDTWPASQRVLRLTYGFDPFDLKRVVLSVVPEIHQRTGPELSYNDGTWTTGSQRRGRAFPAAAFAVTLGPNEFAVLSAGEKANVFGLVGGTFLTDVLEDRPCDSYIFLRLDVTHVDQRR